MKGLTINWKIAAALIVGLLFLLVLLYFYNDLRNAFWPVIEPMVNG